MENFAGAQERLGSPYRFGRSRHWVKSKNPAAPYASGEGRLALMETGGKT